jgi:hypothetical protein
MKIVGLISKLFAGPNVSNGVLKVLVPCNGSVNVGSQGKRAMLPSRCETLRHATTGAEMKDHGAGLRSRRDS